jgi:copper transport protein
VVKRALALAALALALLPAVASAHATLQATIPKRGEKLDAAPAQVVFRFDEPVEAAFGALRVFDAEGNEVQTGEAFHPGGRGAEIAIKLKPGLGDGAYTATYRVVSADGHAISSGFVFSVGDATAPSESLETLLADSGTGPVTNTALAFARGFQYAAIALGLGTLIFFLYCWRGASSAFTRRLERLLLVAALVGFVSAAIAVILQGAVGQGGTFWAAAKPDVVSEVLGTRFGRAWGIGAAVWLVVLAVLALRPLRPGRGLAFGPGGSDDDGGVAVVTEAPPAPAIASTRPVLSPKLLALAVPLFAIALLPSLGGHTSVQKPVAILLPANVLHVLAMSAWLGGIAVLVFALRSATSELEPSQRTPLLAGTVARFSALATIALPLLILSGVVQSIIEVGSFPALLDTPFGRSVLIKIVVALAIVGIGFVNRQKLVPALKRAAAGNTSPGRAGVLIRRTLRFELALGLTALAATGALSSYAPSVAESAGPFSTNVNIGPARLEATVDPAKVGPNEMHFYLFDRKTGAPFEGTVELRVSASMPEKKIAPIELSPYDAGPGHYVVDGATMSVKGDWTISVVDRVSDFDEYEVKFTVPIE